MQKTLKNQNKLRLSTQTVRNLGTDLSGAAGGRAADSSLGALFSALFPEACLSSQPCSDRC
jgi:hypothetical protein